MIFYIKSMFTSYLLFGLMSFLAIIMTSLRNLKLKIAS